MSDVERVAAYQEHCLEQESLFLKRLQRERIAFLPPRLNAALAFLSLHLKQFYWTVTRFLGLRPLDRKQLLATNLEYMIPVTNVADQILPRILIDVTYSATQGVNTGIPRVTREFAKEAYESGHAYPVVIHQGAAYPAYPKSGETEAIGIRRGDILFLLDAGWAHLDSILDLIIEVRRQGGIVVVFIYDVIPFRFPAFCTLGFRQIFQRWFQTVVPQADAILTLSRSSAEEIMDATRERIGHRGAEVPIAFIPLGCRIQNAVDGPPSAATMAACGTQPYFLTVGSIEPRKGHPIALAAFEELWARGSPSRYVILGRTGWSMSYFERHLLQHPEFGRRLFWLQQASEADLAHAYTHAAALIFPSIAEGFGMPIIEAAAFGADVILSDIPVFREVGAYARATFFEVANSHDLATKIECVSNQSKTNKGTGLRPVPTWPEVVATTTGMLRSPRLYQSRGQILSQKDFVG